MVTTRPKAQHSVCVVQDNEQWPLTTTQILLVKPFATPGHFGSTKVVSLRDRPHDGPGSLFRLDGLSVMIAGCAGLMSRKAYNYLQQYRHAQVSQHVPYRARQFQQACVG